MFLVTDSSVDSSSDEHLQTQRESSTTLHNINSSTNNQQQNTITLQRKVSDRKSKRIRAKQNDVTGLGSSTELLKKGNERNHFFVFFNNNYHFVYKLDLMMKY